MGSEEDKRTPESVHDVASDVVKLLTEAGETLGVAESLSGGGIMQTLSLIEGAGTVFRGGVVCYAAPLKEKILKIEAELIARHGIVHGVIAEKLAVSAQDITALDTPTSWGIGTTGVAGPNPMEGKPAGTVFIGIASPEKSEGLGPFQFTGDRHQVQQATILTALVELRRMLRARASQQGADRKE